MACSSTVALGTVAVTADESVLSMVSATAPALEASAVESTSTSTSMVNARDVAGGVRGDTTNGGAGGGLSTTVPNMQMSSPVVPIWSTNPPAAIAVPAPFIANDLPSW